MADPWPLGRPADIDTQTTVTGTANPVEEPGKKQANQSTTCWPDGSTLICNYNKGNEHYKFQHRTGSNITLCPDGSVKIVSAAGQMCMEINGEGLLRVTGAYNIVVDGAASMRVEKDMDWWVGGNMKLDVIGNFAATAQSVNIHGIDKAELASRAATVAGVDTLITSSASTSVNSLGPVKVQSTGSTLDTFSSGATTIKGSTIDLNP